MKAVDLNALNQWTESLDGVFTLADLRVLFGQQTEAALYKKLQRFLDEGVLIKVKRGLYARPTASLSVIASRICPSSYISLGTILAKHALIGSVPARRVQAIKVGRPRSFSTKEGTIEFLSISPRLFFGFVNVNGVRQAEPEKAYIDACYFTYRGKALSFDVAADVDASMLDPDLLADYLKPFDPRFIKFFWELRAT